MEQAESSAIQATLTVRNQGNRGGIRVTAKNLDGDARTDLHNQSVLSGSELWLLRLMADRGLALLDADALLILIEERGELRVAASSGSVTVRLRIVPVDGSALGLLRLDAETR